MTVLKKSLIHAQDLHPNDCNQKSDSNYQQHWIRYFSRVSSRYLIIKQQLNIGNAILISSHRKKSKMKSEDLSKAWEAEETESPAAVKQV